MAKPIPRGIRNHNPGNIKYLRGVRWNGRANPPMDKDGYCVYLTAPDGIRAIARTLNTYQDKRLAQDGSAIDTVQEIIQRWAPSGSENPHQAEYIDFVRHEARLKPGEHVDTGDFETMFRVVPAMIHFENGVQPYSDAQITKGLVMAGLTPPQKPMRKSRTMTGSYVAGASTAGIGLASYLEQYSHLVPTLAGLVSKVPLWAVAAVGLAAVGYVVYARISDRQKGLR